MTKQWHESAFRRNVIDMHIPDWHPDFLRKTDPIKTARFLASAGVQSAVVYAQSHTGLCHYPTRCGKKHRGLGRRDFVQQSIDACHQHDIAVVLYYSLIFNDWAYETYPDWRMIDAMGRGMAHQSRYGVVCPNHPAYRDFVREQISEICQAYHFEGMRFDMTFWPGICYCPQCRSRFFQETAEDLPVSIDWSDPVWVLFQRKREAWMLDFARMVTGTTRALKPGISIEHQSSTFTLNWRFGVPLDLAGESDFLQGDFYGDELQANFVNKLFHNQSCKKLYGFETTTNLGLYDHTTLKPESLLAAKAFTALAHGGAFVFIDAIDPTGTLNERVYDRMQRVFDQTRPYERFCHGELLQDIGIYFSPECTFDPADNGKHVLAGKRAIMDLSDHMPHLDAAVSALQALLHAHLPCGVVTRSQLKNLHRYRLLILPDVLMMREDETEAIRDYVKNGGCLYASKTTSLIDWQGRRHDDFMLADVLGVSYRQETTENLTFMAPAARHADLFADYSPAHPFAVNEAQLSVTGHDHADTLATLVLPYVDPDEPRRYASIHSHPPGVKTPFPSIVHSRFGKGRVIYAGAALERTSFLHPIFIRLLQHLAPAPSSFSAKAPACVHMSGFDQPHENRWVLTLLNFQKQHPPIPVDGIRIRIACPQKSVRQIRQEPNQSVLPFTQTDTGTEFVIDRLDVFSVVSIEFD